MAANERGLLAATRSTQCRSPARKLIRTGQFLRATPIATPPDLSGSCKRLLAKASIGCVNLTQASQGFAQPVPRPRTITVPARNPRVVPAQGLAQGDGLAVGLERVNEPGLYPPASGR